MKMTYSIEEVRNYYSKVILTGTPGKNEIISLLNWMIEWNKKLSASNKIVCLPRDNEKNYKFTYNYDNIPSYLVIKLPGTDRDFPKDLHLDYYYKDNDRFQDIKIYLKERSDKKNHKTRIVLLAKDINKIGINRVRDLFNYAHQLRAK